MVPLFYHSDIEIAKKTLKACYEGGARLLEFTSRGDFAHQIFDELNKLNIKVKSMRNESNRLEELFIEMVKK